MSKVYVKFPKAGLGNLMLIWARACVFAHLNNLPLVTSSWWAFRMGAWKRNERKKRLYFGYFKESSLTSRVGIQIFKLKHSVIREPSIIRLDTTELKANNLFLFGQVMVDNDLFGAIRDHRDFVKASLYEMLNPGLLQQLNNYEVPFIAVHIRRGDFKFGNPITPESFFIHCIRQIRTAGNENWPVTVFTDAAPNEISEVLALPNTSVAAPKPDILDILLMSKSKVIVLSQSSTFSYWAAFLSDSIVIKGSKDWQNMIKKNDSETNYVEINWDFQNQQPAAELIKRISSLNS